MILTPIKRNNKLKLEILIERTYIDIVIASCARIDIDKQIKLCNFRITHVYISCAPRMTISIIN